MELVEIMSVIGYDRGGFANDFVDAVLELHSGFDGPYFEAYPYHYMQHAFYTLYKQCYLCPGCSIEDFSQYFCDAGCPSWNFAYYNAILRSLFPQEELSDMLETMSLG